MNNLAKDAVSLTTAKIITTLIALASSMLLSRFQTLEEYGTYSQILIVVTLATSIFLLGLPNSVNYFLARADSSEEKWKFLSVYYTLSTFLCLIMGVVLALAIPAIVAYFKNPLIEQFTYVLVLLPWTRVVIGSISNVLVVYKQTSRLVIINISNAVIALMSIVIVRFMGLGMKEYMLLYVAGEMLIMVWVYTIVWRLEKPLKPLFESSFFAQIFKYSIPIGLASVVGTINIEVDKLMIGAFYGTEAVAIYTNAGKELPLTLLASSLTAVLLPQMARKLKDGETEHAVSLWGRSVELSYIVICFFVTACVVFAPQIITILYSEKYLDGTAIFRIYSMVLLLRVTYFGVILNSIGKTKVIFYSSLFSLCINVVFNFIFNRFFGFIGPAMATFLSIVAAAILQLNYTGREISVSLSKLFPWKKLLKCTFINLSWSVVASTLVLVLGLKTSTEDIIICLFMGAAISALYIAAEHKSIAQAWKGLNE